MKQIAYLTMTFLPAAFVAVRHPPSLSPLTPLTHPVEHLQHERIRDRSNDESHPRAVHSRRHPPHLRHYLDNHCLPEQTHFPGECVVLDTAWLANFDVEAGVWPGSVCEAESGSYPWAFRQLMEGSITRLNEMSVHPFCSFPRC